EFQRIHVEQDHEQQHHVEHNTISILQPIAAREPVMRKPDQDQLREADREGKESPHRCHELRVAAGNFEGNDEQRDREPEDDVAEGFQASDLPGPPAEILFRRKQGMSHRTEWDKVPAPSCELYRLAQKNSPMSLAPAACPGHDEIPKVLQTSASASWCWWNVVD